MGYAQASQQRRGRRPRIVYWITPAGRRALARWLAQPGAGPEVEFEQLMKVFFAEHGLSAAVAANLEAADVGSRRPGPHPYTRRGERRAHERVGHALVRSL